MEIGVVGLGFVGLTTSLGFAAKGYRVLALDNDKERFYQIKNGKSPFKEPGLNQLLTKHLREKFIPVLTYSEIAQKAKVIYVCVGTPEKKGGFANLEHLYSAIDSIFNNLEENKKRIILVKSTVPPGTIEELNNHIKNKFPGKIKYVTVGSNPEFLREGTSLKDFLNPDRIVVGINASNYERNLISKLYSVFDAKVYFTNPKTAEFVKYLSNTFLSTLISYSNEMSVIARKLGEVDIPMAFELLHMDHRFSGNPATIVSYVFPGCGYGGYCLPKDTKALVSLSQNLGYKPKILQNNLKMNEDIIGILLEDFTKHKVDKSDRIGILGLSFKPDSDDVRGTPAARCIKILLSAGFKKIYAYDPVATSNFRTAYRDLGIRYLNTLDEIINKTDVLIIVTAWREFHKLARLENKKIYDLRYYIKRHD